MSTTTAGLQPDEPVVARRPSRNLSLDRLSFMLVFLGLPLAVYLVFVVSPFVQAVWYSFTNWGGYSNDRKFVGLANYAKLAHNDNFRTAIGNNLLLALVLPLVTIVLALVLASLVTVGGSSHGQVRGLKGSGFYRVVSFFPYTIPAIVIGLMWGRIFDPSAGLVNAILVKLGLHGFKDFPWLGDERTAMPVTMFIIAWGFVGFYMVLFIAAIKGIPSEIFEAARLDGAGRWRTAVSMTIPLIRDNVQTAYIYMGILALDAFVYMQALNPEGGPGNSTLVMAQQLYTTAFTKSQFGLACAMGVVLALMTLAFSAIVFLVNRLTGGKDEVSY